MLKLVKLKKNVCMYVDFVLDDGVSAETIYCCSIYVTV